MLHVGFARFWYENSSVSKFNDLNHGIFTIDPQATFFDGRSAVIRDKFLVFEYEATAIPDLTIIRSAAGIERAELPPTWRAGN